MSPSLQPLLGKSATPASSSPKRKRHLISAIALALFIFAAFVYAATCVHHSIAAHSHVFPVLPAMAVACLAAILPLALFVGCQDEFGEAINPCSPSGYLFIAKRAFAAFGNSESGRVTGKDL